MKFSWLISSVLVLSITTSSTFAARRLTFRPLSAEEVYRILKDAGREDAVPEGRIITQGIAAVSGFALGLKSGIAVPLAIGLATSNATQQFINNINYTAIVNSLPTIPPITLPTINYTALASSLPTINYTALTSGLPTFTLPTLNVSALTSLLKGSSGSANVQYTTQEICFNSRSLNEIDDEDYDDENAAENDDGAELAVSQGRQNPTGTTQTGTTEAATPTTAVTNSPAATATNGDTGTATTVNDGDSTGTNTQSTTQTGTGGSVNCIVIQKPVVG